MQQLEVIMGNSLDSVRKKFNKWAKEGHGEVVQFQITRKDSTVRMIFLYKVDQGKFLDNF